MDLDKAMNAHVEWKMKLRSAIANQTAVDVATLGKDNACELGKWLYGEARVKFGQLASYKECVAAHAQFHREAAKVGQFINQKSYGEAEKALGNGTPFATASSATSVAINRLKKEAVA